MRCTQCGYTTFDYLESCSKCRADLYEVKVRLNLPARPYRPLPFGEILAREAVLGQPVETAPGPEDKTLKMKTSVSTEPRTFDLDLSGDTAVENLSDKWLAKAGGMPGKKGGEPTLNLSLE
jgi:hypothetical protein